MMHLIQFLTIILGGLTVCLSAYLAYRFRKSHHELGVALSIMLFGEATAGFVTVIFALSSYLHIWNTMTPELATFLRWIIFLAVGGTSIHLYVTLQRITDGD